MQKFYFFLLKMKLCFCFVLSSNVKEMKKLGAATIGKKTIHQIAAGLNGS